jgi:hypothetical protein
MGRSSRRRAAAPEFDACLYVIRSDFGAAAAHEAGMGVVANLRLGSRKDRRCNRIRHRRELPHSVPPRVGTTPSAYRKLALAG